ncbi:exodeoxyribonuclease 7 large subunit [Nitrospira sp.]|nr:exodeoxyribonuclease 7 large subunit [Nitrospira sp.]
MSRQAGLFTSSSSAVSVPPPRVWTVSDLSAHIRLALEQTFDELWVEGEVSNLRVPASGHVYFTLKDGTSQIRAVSFRTVAQKSRFALREGMHVIVRGRVSVYEPRGEYQIIVQRTEPKGIGALQVAFEQLKERLAKEGLFDSERKRPLPFLPQCIGVVTSLTGAAIRDILAVLDRRSPSTRVVIAPAPMQGDGAAPLIAEAIRQLGDTGLIDVLIVGRGGGSIEDLWCFNEEVVVRAIAACPVPVVSAIGHEVDVTLSDFAADVRAPTPSAAAEAVVPVRTELLGRIHELAARASGGIRKYCESWRRACFLAHTRLQQQSFPIYRQAQRLDELWSRLTGTVEERLVSTQHRVQLLAKELIVHSPREMVGEAVVSVIQRQIRLRERIGGMVADRRRRVAGVMGSLDALSPLATLDRGYSILQTEPGGRVVRRAQDVGVGQVVKATVSSGQLWARVEQRSVDDRSA